MSRSRRLIRTRLPTLHNGAIAKRESAFAEAVRAILPWRTGWPFIAVSTAAGRWSNALSFPADGTRLETLSDDDAVIVECRVRVHDGWLGIDWDYGSAR